MSYVIPRLEIKQEFSQLAVFADSPLATLIIGPSNYRPCTVTNKALTANVATLTTHQAHGLIVGDKVKVSGIDSIFNGTHTVTAATQVSPFTFSFAKTNADVATAAVSGGKINDGAVTSSITEINSISNIGDIDTKLGPIGLANKLATGVYFAMLNSQNVPVYYIRSDDEIISGVRVETPASYANALKIASLVDHVYNIVPMTNDATFQSEVASHCISMSAPGAGRWRVAWLGTDNPAGSTTSAEITTALVADEAVVGNRRYRKVFPTSFIAGDVTYPSFYAAAALAGLRSGVVPHQPLTNVEVLGVHSLPATNSFDGLFTEEQLDQLAEVGYWILTKKGKGSFTAYSRHQLTTEADNLNTREDSITTNVDSISYGLKEVLAPYIGKYNLNNDTIAKIRSAIEVELNSRKFDTFNARAGQQLINYTIVRIEQSAAFKDKLIVDVNLEVPYPLNYISLTLVV